MVKKRGNGQGSAYRRFNGWEAQVIIGYKIPEDSTKQPIPVKRRKSGFKTKKEALAYCEKLRTPGKTRPVLTLQIVTDKVKESDLCSPEDEKELKIIHADAIRQYLWEEYHWKE